MEEMQEMQVWSLGQEDPLEGGYGNQLQCSCLENPHGQRSLAGYSPWACKKSNMTERLSTEALLKLCSNEAVEVNNAEDSCELKYSEF